MDNNLARGCQWPAASDGNLPEVCGAKAALAFCVLNVGDQESAWVHTLHLSVLILYRDHSVIQGSGRRGDFRGPQLAALTNVKTEMLFQLQAFGKPGKMARGSKCRGLE